MNQLEDIQLSVKVEWRGDFIRWLEEQDVAASSIKDYLQDIRHFAAWFEQVNAELFDPSLITGVDIRAYRSQALEDNFSPATFNRRRASLRRLVAWAMDAGVLSYDPSRGVDRIAQVELPPRWIDEKDLHRFNRSVELAVNGAQTDSAKKQAIRDQAILALMLHTGLREFEVCRLDWEDVTLGERKGKLVVRWGKGNKRREIPLNREARRAVQAWRLAGDGGSGVMFTGKHGERIGVKLVQNRVKAIRVAAGLGEEVTPHALRHTFAKRLLDAGTPLTVVSKLLGHSRLETTARYVQPGWNDFEKAVEKL